MEPWPSPGYRPHPEVVLVVVGWFVLAACLRDAPLGPDLGPCAVIPEGTYGYGEAGIGSCLAGPAAIEFFQQDGGTFLAVTNADPFREFRSGSVEILDWDEFALEFLDLADRPERVRMDQVHAYTLEITDDDNEDGVRSNAFLGGFGYLPDQRGAVVTGRNSETGILRTAKDEAYVLNLKFLEQPGGGILLDYDDTLTLQDDPFPVVIDAPNGLAYVGNLSDHSVSVLQSDPPADPNRVRMTKVDVAPGPTTTEAPLADLDGSGSLAEVSTLTVTDKAKVVEDDWTLTFVEQTVRLWVPTPVDETTDGLHLWTTGDMHAYNESVFPLEQGLTDPNSEVGGDVRSPFVETDQNGLPELFFSRRSDARIFRAVAEPFGNGEWVLDPTPVLFGPDKYFGTISLAPLPGLRGMFVDERSNPNGRAEISLATSADGVSFNYIGPVLTPPAGLSYEDPFAVLDAEAGRYRMWLTVRRGSVLEVALSESADGYNWSDPVPVVENTPQYQYAAPTVAALEGRYGMWAARSDGTVWDTVFLSSSDGWRWSEPELVVAGTSDFRFREIQPPRAAALVDIAGGWRLEANSVGSVTGLLTAGSLPLPIGYFDLAVTNGQEVLNDVVPDLGAELALVPGSAAVIGGTTYLYVSVTSSGSTDRIAILERTADGWTRAVGSSTLAAQLGVAPGEAVSDPTVAADAQGWVLFYTLAARNGTSRIHRATSADGLNFAPGEVANLLSDNQGVEFDAATQRAHSMEVTPSGTYRLWYTGSDGSTQRIGAATSTALRGQFTRDPGELDEWQLGTGLPGGFDDSLVKDPLLVQIDGRSHLYYAGYDGSNWRIGHAELDDAGTFVRRTDPASGLPIPIMGQRQRSFSAAGVDSPVLLSSLDHPFAPALELAYSGFDGTARRIGLASVPLDVPDEMFAAQRFPTAGDTLAFSTARGKKGTQVIELGQATETFSVPGWGMSSMALDSDRGFLYVTTKLDDGVYVIDVRDDSDGSFIDANYLDLEGLLQVDSGSGSAGYRDIVVSKTRGLAYLTQRLPDGLVIVDLTRMPDNGIKELVLGTPVAVLPLQSALDDAGVDTYATFGGAGMTLSADERYLLITHFRGNALSVYDLERGAWGEEIAWIPNLGENPHTVRISPDGRYAVVANYLGDVIGDTVSSTLAIIDLDPESETYLEAVTWLGNH